MTATARVGDPKPVGTVARGRKPPENIASAWVQDQQVKVGENREISEYRVLMKVTFMLNDQWWIMRLMGTEGLFNSVYFSLPRRRRCSRRQVRAEIEHNLSELLGARRQPVVRHARDQRFHFRHRG